MATIKYYSFCNVGESVTVFVMNRKEYHTIDIKQNSDRDVIEICYDNEPIVTVGLEFNSKSIS